MTDFSSNIILVIAVTSIATYLSRSLGVLFSERIDENSKIFRLFDCIAYSTLAALISKVVVFPAGDLGEDIHPTSRWRRSEAYISIGIFQNRIRWTRIIPSVNGAKVRIETVRT